MNRTYKIGLGRTLVFLLVCIAFVCYCNRHEPIHVYEQPIKPTRGSISILDVKIKAQTIKHDTVYLHAKKLRPILKQSRDVIIHDTLKCDTVYKLALKQDTLIRIDSVLIYDLNKQVRNYEKLDTLHTKEIIYHKKKLKQKVILNKIVISTASVLVVLMGILK